MALQWASYTWHRRIFLDGGGMRTSVNWVTLSFDSNNDMYLNQCWRIDAWNLGIKSHWNLTQNKTTFICKMSLVKWLLFCLVLSEFNSVNAVLSHDGPVLSSCIYGVWSKNAGVAHIWLIIVPPKPCSSQFLLLWCALIPGASYTNMD